MSTQTVFKNTDVVFLPAGRLSAAICRLCHGKFSPRSLRHAFNWPHDSIGIVDEESETTGQSPLLFHTDFQRLVGVQLDRDPRLSEFICKKCHAKFYKCHSILIRFLQRVNLPPQVKTCSFSTLCRFLFSASPSFTSDPKCLHSLVSWAHHHGEGCRSCPDLKEVLEGQCWGSVKVVWGCVDGHSYIMDNRCTTVTNPTHAMSLSSGTLGGGRGDGVMSEPDNVSFPPHSSRKRRQTPKALEEPKIKKKPGPKPGWKNKFKPKGEELPNIYKCPYQGCTAVYRAPDGLKKHIKEHHEEVKERPCPHPGCNKVFMIDRYLQRHVKLIHTEERNYICDQCGQTFKQRKHLSVHQMRHSGAKPLQCEVCGFQCRQRASLKYHMTKHKAEADLEFACLICGKRFEKAHNLNVHMSMVHPLTQETEDESYKTSV
uniref:Zinc finger protein 276 n=1 Tax=Mola mola TaxID=94237 RepID=A0A3Q3WX05_MOLML